MLFNEIYGSYFNAVAKILEKAVQGSLTEKEMQKIVRETAFAESVLTIPDSLKNGSWFLMNGSLETPIEHIPEKPLTELEKRWMKSLLSDPRIKLFGVTDEGLGDVMPLYKNEDIVYFDRYCDGDNFEDPQYIEFFGNILTAIKEKRKLRIHFKSGKELKNSWICIPQSIEYSSKDDKFRLIVHYHGRTSTVNLGRIKSCTVLDDCTEEYEKHTPARKTVVMELTDERNALERVLLHFSHLEKETERIDEKHYKLTLRYDAEDETDILIRVLSFGQMVKVVSPEPFINLIKDRIARQKKLIISQ